MSKKYVPEHEQLYKFRPSQYTATASACRNKVEQQRNSTSRINHVLFDLQELMCESASIPMPSITASLTTEIIGVTKMENSI